MKTMAEAITWNRDARFVLVPAESAGRGLRIVVVFNGSGRAGCGEVEAGGAPEAAGTVRMQAVFCDGDRLLADVTASRSAALRSPRSTPRPGNASAAPRATTDPAFRPEATRVAAGRGGWWGAQRHGAFTL